MLRGREKLLIYTIFVLSLTRWTTSMPPVESQLCEEQLAKEVIHYRKLINPGSGIAKPTPDAVTGWITQEVLRSLEYNVRFVLKLVSDFYRWSTSSWETAKSTADEDHKIEVWRVVSEPWQQFETNVCSLVPRLLAFLYACTNDVPKFVQLHRLHSVLCLVMPSMVQRISPEHMNQSKYLCDVKTVTQLHDIKREFSPDQTTTTTNTEVYQKRGTLFVRKTLEWADGVDKKRMLATFLHTEDSQRNVFWVTAVNLHLKRTDGKETGQLDENKISESNEKLWKLNTELWQLSSHQYMDKSTTTMSEQTLPDIVNGLVASAFKTLVMHFGRVVRKLYDKKEPYGRSTVNDMLLIAVASLCEWTPLVLAYLVENCSNTADIAVPFGLYLTLCGDWDGFLQVQCPMTIRKTDEQACVMNAIVDRLLVNFYRVTGSFSGYEVADGDVEATNRRQGMRNPNTVSNYLFAVFKDLYNIYNGLNDELPVWTTSDWLTGKHFLANQRHNPGHPACALGEQTIILSENGARPTAEVLLSEAHNFLLPWHSETRNVFVFHAIVFSHADQTLKEFVNRHVAIVSLYLRHVNRPLDWMLSYPLFHTFGWYVECQRRFHYYLDMPGPRVPLGQWSINDIMLANQNLEGADNENFVGHDATMAEKTAKLSDWANREFSNIPKLEVIDKFKLMLITNCMNAVEYVNDIIRIAQVSKITWKYTEYLQVDYCKQFVNGVLVIQD